MGVPFNVGPLAGRSYTMRSASTSRGFAQGSSYLGLVGRHVLVSLLLLFGVFFGACFSVSHVLWGVFLYFLRSLKTFL